MTSEWQMPPVPLVAHRRIFVECKLHRFAHVRITESQSVLVDLYAEKYVLIERMMALDGQKMTDNIV